MELRKYRVLLNALNAETRSKVAYKNLAILLNKSEAKRKLKGFGPGGITLPLNFQLPDKFGLENLSSK